MSVQKLLQLLQIQLWVSLWLINISGLNQNTEVYSTSNCLIDWKILVMNILKSVLNIERKIDGGRQRDFIVYSCKPGLVRETLMVFILCMRLNESTTREFMKVYNYHLQSLSTMYIKCLIKLFLHIWFAFE